MCLTGTGGQDVIAACVILVNRARTMTDYILAQPSWLNPDRVLAFPILRTAREHVGQRFTANHVAIGAQNHPGLL